MVDSWSILPSLGPVLPWPRVRCWGLVVVVSSTYRFISIVYFSRDLYIENLKCIANARFSFCRYQVFAALLLPSALLLLLAARAYAARGLAATAALAPC